MNLKTCSKCQESKPLTEFYARTVSVDGFQNSCKVCQKHHSKTYAQQNPDQVRKWKLKAYYQLEPGDYEQMLKAQNGRCAICQTSTPGGRFNRFNVDHNHATGKVRGLLCGNCNRGLGYLKDNESILLKAALYLSNHYDDTSSSH